MGKLSLYGQLILICKEYLEQHPKAETLGQMTQGLTATGLDAPKSLTPENLASKIEDVAAQNGLTEQLQEYVGSGQRLKDLPSLGDLMLSLEA